MCLHGSSGTKPIANDIVDIDITNMPAVMQSKYTYLSQFVLPNSKSLWFIDHGATAIFLNKPNNGLNWSGNFFYFIQDILPPRTRNMLTILAIMQGHPIQIAAIIPAKQQFLGLKYVTSEVSSIVYQKNRFLNLRTFIKQPGQQSRNLQRFGIQPNSSDILSKASAIYYFMKSTQAREGYFPSPSSQLSTALRDAKVSFSKYYEIRGYVMPGYLSLLKLSYTLATSAKGVLKQACCKNRTC